MWPAHCPATDIHRFIRISQRSIPQLKQDSSLSPESSTKSEEVSSCKAFVSLISESSEESRTDIVSSVPLSLEVSLRGVLSLISESSEKSHHQAPTPHRNPESHFISLQKHRISDPRIYKNLPKRLAQISSPQHPNHSKYPARIDYSLSATCSPESPGSNILGILGTNSITGDRSLSNGSKMLISILPSSFVINSTLFKKLRSDLSLLAMKETINLSVNEDSKLFIHPFIHSFIHLLRYYITSHYIASHCQITQHNIHHITRQDKILTNWSCEIINSLSISITLILKINLSSSSFLKKYTSISSLPSSYQFSPSINPYIPPANNAMQCINTHNKQISLQDAIQSYSSL